MYKLWPCGDSELSLTPAAAAPSGANTPPTNTNAAPQPT